MKIYELKRDNKFKIVGEETILKFLKMDGMYAQCLVGENLVFLSGNTNIEKVK